VGTVLAVYTGRGLDDTIRTLFEEILPGNRLVNLIDDSMIADVVAAGNIPSAVYRRLIDYFLRAHDIGADIIFNTCSSVGDVVAIARNLTSIPIVRIDEPMVEAAVSTYNRIGVLATLPSTLDPTKRLIEHTATVAAKHVTIVDGLAVGAYDALVSGSPQEHDRKILETAGSIAESVDGIVLAQGSMTRIEAQLQECTGIPVLSSPKLGLERVRDLLNATD
jgi:Asp/Glu/hydantoin racemase